MPETPERKFSPEQIHTFSLVEKHVGLFESQAIFNERIYPALRLFGYNFFTLHQDPTDEDILEFRDRCLKINEQEERAASPTNPLCSIGGELNAFYTPATRATLHRLGIRIDKEDDSSNRLWQVVFPWTYSAEAQIVMLQELVTMHAINPLPLNGPRMRGRRRMALHLNYAMPGNMEDFYFTHNDIRKKLYDLNDALLIGFTSPERLRELEGAPVSVTLPAEETKKISKRFDPHPVVFRMELLGLEFTTPLAYTLLHDSQRLVTAYFAWVMSHFVPQSERDKRLATIFMQFQAQFTKIRSTYQIPPNFIQEGNTTKQQTVQLVENSDLPAQVRQLISQAGMEVDQVLAAA